MKLQEHIPCIVKTKSTRHEGKAYLLHFAEEMMRRERLVRLSPSMMARDIHRIHPVAPFFQSLIGPGAHP